MPTGVPADLVALKEPLIEAVIDAYMKKQIPVLVDGIEWDHGGVKSGEFRYKHSRFGMDTKAYCYYPAGNWKVDLFWSGDREANPGDSINEDFTLFDPLTAWSDIRNAVSEWIDPWIACQDPNDLAGAIAALVKITNALYVQSEVRVEDRLGTGSGDATGSPDLSSPLADIRAAIVDIGSLVETLSGNAIEALKAAYITDVGLTISGQRALAAIATLAIAGEGEAWGRAFGDLVAFFAQATKDFQSFADGHGATDGSTTLSVVSGVAGLASVGTAAFPPASLALGAISGLAGLGSIFLDGSVEAVPTVTLVLNASNFDTMWSSFTDGVRAVKAQIRESEEALAMMCRRAVTDFRVNPDSYSITAVGLDMGNPQPGDHLARFLHASNDNQRALYGENTIEIVHDKLRRVSGRIEHIGDHQREVAKLLSTGDLTTNTWSRQYLEGTIIGWGPDGHHSDYADVIDALTDLLVLEATTAHRVAVHAYDISTSFAQTDAQIEAGLNRLERALSS